MVPDKSVIMAFALLLLLLLLTLVAAQTGRGKDQLEKVEELFGETLYSWNEEGEIVEAPTKELLQGLDQSLTHLHIHSRIFLLAHSLMYSLTYLCTHSLILVCRYKCDRSLFFCIVVWSLCAIYSSISTILYGNEEET